MNNRTLSISAFVLVALAQLFVPGKMIWDREDILSTGTEFHFRTAPIDPNDPFRGKYIVLSYNETFVEVEDENNWIMGEEVYAEIDLDEAGFAKIVAVGKEPPTDHRNYLKSEVNYASRNGSNELIIDYPFNRFYMEESKAPEAEVLYREVQPDTSKVTYAVVRIKEGEAVLKDVMIDGISIREIVLQNRKPE